MKKILIVFITGVVTMLCTGSVYAAGFTSDISKESFEVSIDKFFPSFGTTDKIKDASGEGIDNIKALIISLIPMITTMMAVGAVLMVVW